MSQDNNFLDGWIISLLKTVEKLPPNKITGLVMKMDEYLQQVRNSKQENNKAKTV